MAVPGRFSTRRAFLAFPAQLHKTAREAPGGPSADLLMTPEDLGLGEDLAAKLAAMANGDFPPVRLKLVEKLSFVGFRV